MFKVKVLGVKILEIQLILYSVFLLASCGGVVGNIKKYEYEKCSKDEIVTAINELYEQNPEFIKKDSLYGVNDSEYFYFVSNFEKSNYVFNCHVVESQNGVPVELSLTAAAKYGEIMKLAPKLTFSEKRHYIRIFENNILPKIEKYLKCK